ncbi:helix-turn-helix transcriptional regulator [Streptomyces sp. NRRL F-5123]|uniref:helix-turn-helix transcriptional regulator n=1 Tax=Streptomyces sp. NRRL F-5123 TaxID=1463856 RepID=UPI0004E19D1B|nr:helix-turn-helix transcriptional regulator [Streptomyces sp. NRRL F-5123]
MADVERRRELAEFIRSRRERRSPEDAGLRVVGQRRTPGLRREEVATLAGLSITWYTWLEQGREIKVSRQVLGSLVPALGLDTVERDHLYRLAGEVPPADPPAGPPAPSGIPRPYELLLAHLDPNPSFVVNRRFDVLAWNAGCELILGDLAALPAERRNILWLTFTSPEARAVSLDWEEEAAHTLALFRAQVGEHILDPDVVALLRGLERASPDFGRLWGRKDLTPYVPKPRTIAHPLLGEATFEYAKMHIANDDKTVVSYLTPPGSDLDRRLREALAAREQSG